MVKHIEKFYATKIKSINEQQYYIKITKDWVEVKAPTLNDTLKLLRNMARYKEDFDSDSDV